MGKRKKERKKELWDIDIYGHTGEEKNRSTNRYIDRWIKNVCTYGLDWIGLDWIGLIDRFMDWLIDLFDWLIDWLIDWFDWFDWFNWWINVLDWFLNWLIG